jgi:Xaa-Pro aminopeptidase
MLEGALSRLREAFSGADTEALLVTHPANVRYLSGFRAPEDGRVLVTDTEAVLVTDGRYIAQAGEESRLPVEIFEGSWVEHLAARLGGRNLAFEAEGLTYTLFEELKEKLDGTPRPTRGLVAELRLVKTPAERELLRQAAGVTDEAFTHILGFIRADRMEVEVALELERFMRAAGTEGAGFEIIVASGTRSAMPHGTASSKEIKAGELVTLDFGAKVEGYHADMTRTVAVGQLSDAHAHLYAAVLRAQEAALEALSPGKRGREVDAVARDSLDEAGLGDRFSHSLGHGVGLEIHEGPRLSKTSEQVLEPGMSVTIEPGAYVPGDAGVRIEDLALITEAGYERLSESRKDLITL